MAPLTFELIFIFRQAERTCAFLQVV